MGHLDQFFRSSRKKFRFFPRLKELFKCPNYHYFGLGPESTISGTVIWKSKLAKKWYWMPYLPLISPFHHWYPPLFKSVQHLSPPPVFIFLFPSKLGFNEEFSFRFTRFCLSHCEWHCTSFPDFEITLKISPVNYEIYIIRYYYVPTISIFKPL